MKVSTNGDELVNVAGRLVPKWQEPIRIAQAMAQAKAQAANEQAEKDKATEAHHKSELVAAFLISLGLPAGEEDNDGRILGQFKFWIGYHKHEQLYVSIQLSDEQDKLLREYNGFEGLIDRTMIKLVEPVAYPTGDLHNPVAYEGKGYAPHGSLVELQAWIADTMDRLTETLESNLKSAASYHNTRTASKPSEEDRIDGLLKSMIRQVLYEMRDVGDLS